MARITDRTLCPGLAVGDAVIRLTFAASELPHAEVHTIILPHAIAYNRAGAPAAMARIARALGAEDAAAGLFDLAAALGAKQSLAEIGLRESVLDRAANLAVQSPYPNPTPLTRERIRALLDDAFLGRRPPA
jgi:maleylacetate reductase